MNPVRKRLRLSPSKAAATNTTGHSVGPPRSSPQLLAHDALPAAASAGDRAEEEEEEEGYLLVEEDATDSSLIITMGNAHTHTHSGEVT